MKLRIVLTVLAALAVFGGIFGYKYYTVKKAALAAGNRKPIPATVAAQAPTRETWATTLHAVGTLQSFRGITIRSEIEGRISRIAFESGAVVHEGDVLIELDTSAEAAQLAASEARSKFAHLTLERTRELRDKTTNSQADLDAAEAAATENTARVEELKAILAKKRIVAPFSGRLGIREVNPGQFLNKGDGIVVLEAVNPIYADFGLPQQDISSLQIGLPVRVAIDAYPEKIFEGKVEATSPRINDDTRSVRVRAVIPNPDETLKPGMFARVDVILPTKTEVLVLPATAITFSPYGDSVFVITEEKNGGATQVIAKQRFIQVGPRRGDQVSIVDGLKPDETVVIAGQIKLRNGSPVRVDNKVIPSNLAAPHPAES